jgi:ABC-type Na+ efflux pump permease subunit
MNMILNPQELPQKIPAAIKLLEEYMAQRDSVDLTQDNARAILEHFGNADSGGDTQARLQPKSTKARKS